MDNLESDHSNNTMNDRIKKLETIIQTYQETFQHLNTKLNKILKYTDTGIDELVLKKDKETAKNFLLVKNNMKNKMYRGFIKQDGFEQGFYNSTFTRVRIERFEFGRLGVKDYNNYIKKYKNVFNTLTTPEMILDYAIDIYWKNCMKGEHNNVIYFIDENYEAISFKYNMYEIAWTR